MVRNIFLAPFIALILLVLILLYVIAIVAVRIAQFALDFASIFKIFSFKKETANGQARQLQ
jgi:hypothetical protein